VPSLDTADTTLAVSTIDESLNTGQRDPRTMQRQQEPVESGWHCEFARRTIYEYKRVGSAGDSS
jgi:hypothetical protein